MVTAGGGVSHGCERIAAARHVLYIRSRCSSESAHRAELANGRRSTAALTACVQLVSFVQTTPAQSTIEVSSPIRVCDWLKTEVASNSPITRPKRFSLEICERDGILNLKSAKMYGHRRLHCAGHPTNWTVHSLAYTFCSHKCTDTPAE